MNFSPGDVLMLDQHPGDPMLCLVEAIRNSTAAGVFKGNHAAALPKC